MGNSYDTLVSETMSFPIDYDLKGNKTNLTSYVLLWLLMQRELIESVVEII